MNVKRFLQFRLRTVFAVITFLAIVGACVNYRLQAEMRETHALHKLQELGFTTYDYDEGAYIRSGPPTPCCGTGLRRVLPAESPATKLSRDDARWFLAIRKLNSLDLNGIAVSEEALVKIRRRHPDCYIGR
jgi:hypothetical protein